MEYPSNISWGDVVAGGKLKETGTTHWNSQNVGATNETGFTALPGGYRGDSNGDFWAFGYSGFWWTSTPSMGYDAYLKYMENGNTYLTTHEFPYYMGLSVRCLKD
jgi:uncharacterized protein (TIGR02145 family)